MSTSPTPSPSSITPTTSPNLSSNKFIKRDNRRISRNLEDLDEDECNSSIHNRSASFTSPSLTISPPASSNANLRLNSIATTMSPSAAASSSTGSDIGLGNMGNGKAGMSIINNTSPSSNPASSRSPPYYSDLGNIGTSSGARAPPLTIGANKERAGHRKRSSSLVTVEKIEQSHEELLDQSAGFNANADWVNYKGAWVIHVVLILLGKILVDVIPGMEQDTSWTIVNLGYIAVSYLMFHYVTGTPFESNAGVYDELTLWEQIDEGAQYTPAKKWLTSVPIGLFLVSTHYTRYNPWLFSLNFFALLFVLFPKLPILHRLRFKVMPFTPPHTSLPPTPTHSRPNSAAGYR